MGLLHRSAWPDLIRLGWPVSATLLVRLTMRTVDILVVGIAVGATGVAALGIGDAFARVLLMTVLGLGAGVIATVSQDIGADRRHHAHVATTQAVLLAVAVGVPFTVAGWFGARAFFQVLGAEADVVETGVTYLRIVMLSAVPRAIALLTTRAFQGAGDTTTPFVLRTVGTAVNITLTVLLVPGHLDLPRLGVTGAAFGTAIGNVTSALLLLATLARGRRVIGFAAAGLRAWSVGARIVRIGWPQVVERNIYAIGAIPLNAIVLVFGTAANAGFQVGRRVMLFGLLPSRGVATAASTYMGHHVGRAHPDRGDHYGRGGIALAALVSIVVAVPLFALARPVADAFLRDGDALDLATTWVRVYAAVTVLRAMYGVLRSAMQGAGETFYPLVATAVGTAGFALATSYVVGVVLGVGLVGVYIGVLLDPAVRTTLLYRWYDQGRWRRALRDDALAAYREPA